jgi:hypothetical protein
MRLYIYRALDKEKVPWGVTHVMVHESVTTIKIRAFAESEHLVSIIIGDNVKRIENHAFFECDNLVSVIMGDNVKRIEYSAFADCFSLRFIRLSKTLEFIGMMAFSSCQSLEALVIPSTLKSIKALAFNECYSLRVMILPRNIDVNNFGEDIINETIIQQIAEQASYAADEVEEDDEDDCSEIHCRTDDWIFLISHMDEMPFHKLCYDSSVNTQKINDYINEHGNNSALQIEAIHGMSPLHMLSMNPYASVDAISVLFNSNMEAVFRIDNQQKTALDYAREYNVGGMVAMILGLCNNRNSSRSDKVDTNESATKKRRI